MSGYPPPPPPSSGAAPYTQTDWKAQRRLIEAQRKAAAAQQRAQYKLQRAQMRAARRGSLVGPLLLVILGIVFLLTQTGSLPWSHLVSWYSRWWPAVMIIAGLMLLAEWGFARQRQQAGMSVPTPVLGGGVIVLLILLAAAGWALRYAGQGAEWTQHLFYDGGWAHMMGDAHESDSTLAWAIAPGQPLLVRCPHGDVVVTGSSQDGQVHVSVHKQVYAWQESDAENRERQIEPQFSTVGGQLQLIVPALDGGQADLTLEVPRENAVFVEAVHGDITVHELHAPVTLTANNGDIEMQALSGPVNIHISHDNASVSGRSLNGDVSLEGRSGDINLSDVTGNVTLHGDFFGATHLERVNGQVRFQTSRTQFEAARLDGELEVDTGADLQANELTGPVVLNTRNRNIELDRVSGHVQISNRNGSVTVTQTAPFGGIQVTNQRGSVDVGVPAGAAFVLNAQTRHGDVENDFGLSKSGSDESPVLAGTVRSGGPLVSLVTTDGDITVRKTAVAPLPPKPPAPPRISSVPKAGVPEAPALPVTPELPSPKTPREPSISHIPATHTAK